MLKSFRRLWNQYKYRFVPWLAANFFKNEPRVVTSTESDKVIRDDVAQSQLLDLLKKFSKIHVSVENRSELYRQRMETMYKTHGFNVERHPSNLKYGGRGVFVTAGHVKQGNIVCLYPGVIYQPWETMFFVSLGNSFLFRCKDGVYIDGKDTGVSKMIYRGCAHRDRILGEYICDTSWLTEEVLNPLAVGQYVNNQNKEYPANVAYQELDIPADFPLNLRKYIPNIEAKLDTAMEDNFQTKLLRTVVLVAIRDIKEGEELFSNYFTIVHES